MRQLGEMRVRLHKRAFLFRCCLVERVLENKFFFLFVYAVGLENEVGEFF